MVVLGKEKQEKSNCDSTASFWRQILQFASLSSHAHAHLFPHALFQQHVSWYGGIWGAWAIQLGMKRRATRCYYHFPHDFFKKIILKKRNHFSHDKACGMLYERDKFVELIENILFLPRILILRKCANNNTQYFSAFKSKYSN